MRTLLLALIGIYRRHISPHKGFSCAYRVHTGRCSCSALGERAVRRFGVIGGLQVLNQRLTLCGVAHRRFGPAGKGAATSGQVRAQDQAPQVLAQQVQAGPVQRGNAQAGFFQRSSPQPGLSQRGLCDCDLPLGDACSFDLPNCDFPRCDLPGGRGCSLGSACDCLSCLDCGDCCTWDKPSRRKRKGHEEKAMYVPPFSTRASRAQQRAAESGA